MSKGTCRFEVYMYNVMKCTWLFRVGARGKVGLLNPDLHVHVKYNRIIHIKRNTMWVLYVIEKLMKTTL